MGAGCRITKGANFHHQNFIVYHHHYHHHRLYDPLFSAPSPLLPSTSSLSKFGATPLHEAAFDNKMKAVAALISHGADVNAIDYTRGTPLMYASQEGHAMVVEALLDAGAKKEMLNTQGNNALHYAKFHGKDDVVEVLERS